MESKPPRRNLLGYATVGIEFLLVFLLFLYAGWQVDKWIRWTHPAVTILGGLTGFGIAMWRLTKQGWGILKDEEEPRRRDRKDRPDKKE